MFLGSKGHNWPGSIKKSKIYNRFSHTKALLFKKRDHILAKIPVLGNLTNMYTYIYLNFYIYMFLIIWDTSEINSHLWEAQQILKDISGIHSHFWDSEQILNDFRVCEMPWFPRTSPLPLVRAIETPLFSYRWNLFCSNATQLPISQSCFLKALLSENQHPIKSNRWGWSFFPFGWLPFTMKFEIEND